MNPFTLLVITALAGRTAPIVAHEPTAPNGLTICMGLGFDVQPLFKAQKLASTMFTGIGIRTDWRTRGDACSQRGPIIVNLLYDSAPSDHPDAWGYAMPYEGAHVVIFWDRIQRKMPPTKAPILLAHVLVHEITHILEGVGRHSKSGIMKAKWDENDLFQMFKKPLGFDTRDLELIRRGVAARSSSRPKRSFSLIGDRGRVHGHP